MKPTLSQVCTLSAPFATDVEEYAAAGCEAVEVWLTKLEEHLKTATVDEVRGLLEQHSVTLPVASFQGGLLISQGEERRAHWDHFARRLKLCGQLNIGTLVVACDIAGFLTQETLDRASASLAQSAKLAEEHAVRIALEFQRQAAFGNNLQTVAAMIGEAAIPNVGICLDAFHFFTGPSKLSDLGYLTTENLFHVQFSDIAGIPREIASDSDRILPGDGDFQLESLIERLRHINYSGHVSIELMNPQIWESPPRQFGEVGMSALKRVLEI